MGDPRGRPAPDPCSPCVTEQCYSLCRLLGISFPKNAVIDAAVRGARYEKDRVELQDLIEAIDRIKAARVAVKSHEGRK